MTPSTSTLPARARTADTASRLAARSRTAKKSVRTESLPVDQVTFLEKSVVGNRTLAVYQTRVAHFMNWAAALRLAVAPIAMMDVAVPWHMDEQYHEGAPGSDASKILAALGALRPELTRGAHELRRAHRAAQGWMRLSPAVARMPIPWVAVLLIVNDLVARVFRVAAQACVMAFALYLRPSEALRILNRNVVSPPSFGPENLRRWSVILHPEEEGVPSKTRIFDESLTLDNPEFVALDDVLRLTTSRAPDAPLFNLTYRQWTDQFQSAVSAARLPAQLGVVVLYRLRHGGASHELYTRFRDLSGVQVRGRWASVQGPKRYGKPGRLPQLLKLFSRALRTLADRCAARLGALLCGKSPALRRPHRA